jgi:hypothetical protein
MGFLAVRGLKLELPFENARAAGRRFSFGDSAGILEGDGKRCVSEWVVGGKSGESHGGGDGLVDLAGVAQGSNQAVMGFNVVWVRGDGGSEGMDCFLRLIGGEKVESMLGERVGGGRVVHGWF